MVEIVESLAEKKERKRLKKLAALQSGQKDDSCKTSSEKNKNETSEEATVTDKKERKRLKKLAKLALLEENTVDSANNMITDDASEKKKKKKKSVLKEESEKVDKKSKKRKTDDWNDMIEEEEKNVHKENVSTNAWTKMMKQSSKKTAEGEPPLKKKKKDKEDKSHDNEAFLEEEKGVFRKIFYKPTTATTETSDEEVSKFRAEHNMNVSGRLSELYKPIRAFKEFSTDQKIMSVCQGFTTPTPIQAQCWPIIASGRDIIGVAETGSGKTLAFSLPALAHMLYRYDNPVKGIPANPIMLVLSPTRELAMQTQVVMEKAGKDCYIRSVCCYGGVPKWEQKRALRWGVEVVVATPGRLKDLVSMGCVSLAGVSYLVLDEADRMLDQGFEEDIRHIIGMTHKDRQTCLFSATWPEAIRQLAQEFLTDPIKVTVGSDDLSANKRIKQIVEVIDERDKTTKLLSVLEKYNNNNQKIIVFVLKKAEAHDIEDELWHKGYKVQSIHGDKSQWDREYALKQFKNGAINILVATDVAARGLDIPDVEFVVNYSFPQTIEDYVHRIGRTGRAGKDGIAHSFFHRGDSKLAGCLVKVLKDANQEVPQEMFKFNLRINNHTFQKFFNKNGNEEAPRQCNSCGDLGHISRFCPKNGGGGGFSRGRGRGAFGRGGGGGRGGGRERGNSFGGRRGFSRGRGRW